MEFAGTFETDRTACPRVNKGSWHAFAVSMSATKVFLK
jgi:hypothetical protein